MNTKPFFITNLDYKLLKEKYSNNELEQILKRIENGYPVQYAIGNVEFLNSTILVDKRVLIPRFETELLVHKLIKMLDKKKSLDILDLCTGSGCIAISLKKGLENASVDAADIDKNALNLARENAKLNQEKISFFEIDVLKDFNLNKKYDLIVSNPPYVAKDEIVDPKTKYEPSIALFPGDDDIIFYKTIIKKAKNLLKENGFLAFEIGYKQGERIKSTAIKEYPNAKVTIEKDFNDYDRFVFITFE